MATLGTKKEFPFSEDTTTSKVFHLALIGVPATKLQTQVYLQELATRLQFQPS